MLIQINLTLLDPGHGRFSPLNISVRNTFEVRLNYYPRNVRKKAQDPKDEVSIFMIEKMLSINRSNQNPEEFGATHGKGEGGGTAPYI